MTADAFFKSEASLPVPTKDLLSWIFDAPTYSLEKKIFIDADDPSIYLTAGACKDLIRKLVKGLHDSGLQDGDCVQIHSVNNIYYPVVVLGIIAAGGVFTGSSPAGTVQQLAYQISAADVKFVLCEPELLEPFVRAAEISPTLPDNRIWVFDQGPSQKLPERRRSWRDLLVVGEADWKRFDDLDTQKSTTAMRLFSSGTTGPPKAVELTHRNFVAEHVGAVEYKLQDYEIVLAIVLPMCHSGVSPYVHTGLLKAGHCAYILRVFDVEKLLATVERHQVTEIPVVPLVTKAIVMSPHAKKYSLRSVQSAFGGSAPCSKELQRQLLSLLGGEGKSMTQLYGMTESTVVATRFWHPENDETGSAGRLIPNVEAKLVNATGEDISAYNTMGEICMRGPTIMKEYFRNPKATADAVDTDGFYHSGDFGYCDEATKKWYIIDRVKELFQTKHSSAYVSPAEIEGIIMQHPSVFDAAVIAVPLGNDEGLAARAYILARPGATWDEKEFVAWSEQQLEATKRLRGGVVLVDDIPKSSSGKILKNALRDKARQEMESKM